MQLACAHLNIAVKPYLAPAMRSALSCCSAKFLALSQAPCAQAPELAGLVEQLLLAVKTTNDFEAELTQQFGGQGAEAAAAEVRCPVKLCTHMTLRRS